MDPYEQSALKNLDYAYGQMLRDRVFALEAKVARDLNNINNTTINW